MLRLGLPGSGLVRRLMTLGLCVLAFWAGARLEHGRLAALCRNAGGAVGPAGLCRGLS